MRHRASCPSLRSYAHLALERVGQADDDEAEMQQHRMEGQDGGFLAAVPSVR